MRQIIQIILCMLLLISSNSIYAYTSSDLFNIYYQGDNTWQNIYNVPEGKDLLIRYLYTDNTMSANLFIADWSSSNIVWGWAFNNNEYNVDIIIHDSLYVIDSASTNNYTITWLLVDEGQDIKNIIDKNNNWINKPVFTQEVLDEIYQYQAVLMILITIITFIFRITGKKQKKKIIFW